MGTQLLNALDGEVSGADDLEDAYRFFENNIFIGGPRVSLAFGWRF